MPLSLLSHADILGNSRYVLPHFVSVPLTLLVSASRDMSNPFLTSWETWGLDPRRGKEEDYTSRNDSYPEHSHALYLLRQAFHRPCDNYRVTVLYPKPTKYEKL